MAFADILNKPLDEAEAPKPLPIGTYQCQIKKVPQMTERGDFDIIEFDLNIIKPEDDVDLSDYEGEVAGKMVRHSFLFSKTDKEAAAGTLFRLKQFLGDHLGLEIAGKSTTEALAMVPGSQCLVSTKWDPDKNDPSRIYTRVKSTAAV